MSGETASEADGFATFGSRRVVRGQLYKITPIESDLRARVQVYVESAMQRDHQYVRNLYGRVNPVLQKDYDYFWESPWLQEHGQDTQKRRRIEEQQKNLAVRNYMKSQQDIDDVEGYIQRVDQLMDWEERSYKKNVVKTVSRIVQSYELDAVRNLISVLATRQLRRPSAEAHLGRLLGSPSADINITPHGVEPVAHTLRRNPTLSDLFVGVVASELILAVVCGGGSSVSIHMSRLRHAARDNAIIQLLNAMEALPQAQLPLDTIGLPLMEVNGNMCVRKGLLVVTGGASAARYILDIIDDEESRGVPSDLTGVRTIHLTNDIIREDTDPPALEMIADAAVTSNENSKGKPTKKAAPPPIGALV